MEIVYTTDMPFPPDQNIVLYDRRFLNHRADLKQIDYPYAYAPKKNVLNLVFEKEGKLYRILNTHIPGDPKLPSKEEFASYVNTCPDEVVIAMGDMNFNREEMHQAFLTCGGKNLPFALISSYPSDISPTLHSKTIDHIYVKGAYNWNQREPEEVIKGLTPTLELLTASEKGHDMLTAS